MPTTSEPDGGRSLLLRGLELAVVVVLTLVWGAGGAARPLVLGALAVASAAWIAWMVRDPRGGRRPVGLGGADAAVVTVLLAVVAGAGGLATGRDDAGLLYALSVVACIAAGRDVGPVGGAVAWASGTAGVQVGLLLAGHFPPAAVLAYPAGLLAAVFGGVVRAGRRDREAQTRELLHAAERANAEQARNAALAERTRIAREVHDVLAHSLGALAVQLEVADALLEGPDPDGTAKDAARQRVRTAHELVVSGLEETRRAVHVLRADAPPLPDALATLAAGARDSGAEVEVRVAGRPRPLGGSELALLRTAQEALVNAAKHAPGAAVHVELDYREDDTTLTVVNSAARGTDAPRPRSVDGGFGLAGLRERLELAGGSLSAGPVGRGWRVRASVPA